MEKFIFSLFKKNKIHNFKVILYIMRLKKWTLEGLGKNVPRMRLKNKFLFVRMRQNALECAIMRRMCNPLKPLKPNKILFCAKIQRKSTYSLPFPIREDLKMA